MGVDKAKNQRVKRIASAFIIPRFAVLNEIECNPATAKGIKRVKTGNKYLEKSWVNVLEIKKSTMGREIPTINKIRPNRLFRGSTLNVEFDEAFMKSTSPTMRKVGTTKNPK
jgi:hypothetical protein